MVGYLDIHFKFTYEWVNMAITNHYDLFVSILSPEMPEYAQVGGLWEKLSTRKDQLKEGAIDHRSVEVMLFALYHRDYVRPLKTSFNHAL